MKYIKNILVALDQLGNALLGGDPDETISSRAGKCVKRGGNTSCQVLCKILNYIDRDHCSKSIEKDEGRDAVWH